MIYEEGYLLDIIVDKNETNGEWESEHDLLKLSQIGFQFYVQLQTWRYFATFIPGKGKLIIWKAEPEIGTFNELQHMLFRKNPVVSVTVSISEYQNPIIVVTDENGGVYTLEQPPEFSTF